MRRARIISLNLRVTEYSLPIRMFLATCWVIVEPPRARVRRRTELEHIVNRRAQQPGVIDPRRG